ncbi:hypothetical protein C1645_456581 [Glomus cerebriforme]|uniref:Uncharacterized protein n=1 Tax=Glomus cerebriforme TaxID=658196 RepID=A0A397SLE7_9GLOM|nr:hypothetical protein C1645_456581 [Glomus cerebriforme]
MANNERGGTIREYIDARKKGGMTWDEFRKLKSEVDGPQFSEYELAKYRRKLDEEREAKLKGLGSGSLNKKKRKKHHYRRHSSSRDRDHKRKRSKSEESLTRSNRSPVRNRNFSDHEDEYYGSDEGYEKHDQRRIDEKDRNERVVEKHDRGKHDKHLRRKSSSVESGAYESAADSEDKMSDGEDKKHHHHHHNHHHRHSHKKHKNKHKVQEEEHRGDTPVRLSEFLKHGSSSSDE